MDTEDGDEHEGNDLRAQIFHNTVREHIIFLILFLLLYSGSYILIGRYRKRDCDDTFATDDDELLVYRISLWLCTFSLAIAIGAALLVPISIASNEVLLLYPNSFYVKWLNSSLIQGLWNYVFLFSNVSLFVLLPFSYLFSESAGFVGHKKGVISRVYETFTVFSLLAVVVLGITFVISALIDRERSGLQTLLYFGSNHLPFLYSCVSCLGVLLLLVFTPIGFIRLFGVVGQILVKPLLLRDIDDEFQMYNMEKAFIQRKISNANNFSYKFNDEQTNDFDTYKRRKSSLLFNKSSINNYFADRKCIITYTEISSTICTNVQKYLKPIISINNHNNNNSNNNHQQDILNERLRELETKKHNLDVLRSSTAFQRNVVYPAAMLLLLLLTGITVLIVMQNTLELLIGIKALPLSTQQLTLGITSLSKLGPIGAAIEVLIILYLEATSSVGLYTMPFMRLVRPTRQSTSLSQLIVNCALVLVLSSAQPLLSRIIGITNFDLLGDFGSIEWLGNFQIVLLYNLIFGIATAFCLINKFTATVRQELCTRLVIKNVF